MAAASGKPHSRTYPGVPQVGVGAVVVKDGRVLLVKRAKDPGKGLWAIPGGRVRLGESLKDACEREIWEETGLKIKAGKTAWVFDRVEKDLDGQVKFHYVIVDLFAEYLSGTPKAGDDAAEARFIAEDQARRLDLVPETKRLLTELLDFSF